MMPSVPDVDREGLRRIVAECVLLVKTTFGFTAFPFSTTDRVLHGEPVKRLSAIGTVLPTVVKRGAPRSNS